MIKLLEISNKPTITFEMIHEKILKVYETRSKAKITQMHEMVDSFLGGDRNGTSEHIKNLPQNKKNELFFKLSQILGNVTEIKNRASVTRQQVKDLIQKLFRNTENTRELGQKIMQIFNTNDFPSKYGPWDEILDDLNPMQLSILYNSLMELDKNELGEIKQFGKISPESVIDTLMQKKREDLPNALRIMNSYNYNDFTIEYNRKYPSVVFGNRIRERNFAFLQYLEKEGKLKEFFLELNKVEEIKQIPRKHTPESVLNLLVKVRNHCEYVCTHYQDCRSINNFPYLVDKYQQNHNTQFSTWIKLLDQNQLNNFYQDLLKFIKQYDLKVSLDEAEKPELTVQNVVDLYFHILSENDYDVQVFIETLEKYGFPSWKRANPSYSGIRDFIKYLDERGRLKNFYNSLLKIDDKTRFKGI